MDIQDLIFDSSVSMEMKTTLLQVMADNHAFSPYTKVLVPTETNDDVNGSQHVTNGGNDFTYRDATEDDVASATTLGYYEYFSGYGSVYTGHYYEGDSRYFEAVVLDPPAYAATYSI